MNTLQEKLNQEITSLPLSSQKEVLDFVLFIKQTLKTENDTDFLSKMPEVKQAIIEGLNTPLNECSVKLDW